MGTFRGHSFIAKLTTLQGHYKDILFFNPAVKFALIRAFLPLLLAYQALTAYDTLCNLIYPCKPLLDSLFFILKQL